MNRTLLLLFATLFLAAPALAQVPDSDGDGVPDDVDACPTQDASFFDADGDGCVDDFAHARHIEYWAPEDLPLTYVVHEGGAPLIDVQEVTYVPGQEIDEVVAGFDVWETVPGVTMASNFAGTTPDSVANGTDGVNLVTFRDPDFIALFGNTVIAVGLTTSFTEPGTFNGNPVRPGQIVDADMLFNPARTFSADTSQSAVEIQAVAVHEAGHLFGLNHSALVDATMFPALPAGFDATTLEIDDQVLAYMSYPDPATVAGATLVSGLVTDGATGTGIPGAAVFALNAGTDQKVAVQYTLPDGTWSMAGLPAGAYDIFVAPLDGGSNVNGVVPGFVNALVDSTAQTLFLPDFYDDAESATEDPGLRTSITLAPGAPVEGIQIITNADEAPPIVTGTTPAGGAVDADADGVILVRFSEPIEFASVQNSGSLRFRLQRNDTTGPVTIGGQLVAVGTKDVLVFTPAQPLTFDANYTITLDAGIEDRFGNATTTDFQASFDVESRPPLAVNSISPSIVVGGSLVVISGEGFDATGVTNNSVTLGDGTPLNVTQATTTSLVAQLPTGLDPGVTSIDVATTTETVTGAGQIEIVNVVDTARATPVTSIALSGRPNDVAVLPDAQWVLAATDAGLEAVVVDGTSAAFGNTSSLPFPAGLDGVDIDPSGLRAYAVSRAARSLVLIDTDDGGDPAFPSPSFLSPLLEIPTGAAPLGIAVAPDGRSAWVTTSDGVVQVWDLAPGETQFQLVGEIAQDAGDQPLGSVQPTLAFGPTGNRVYFLTDRDLHVADADTRAVITSIDLGVQPTGVAASPQGDLVYVSDVDGNVSVVPVTATSPSQVVAGDASFRGIAVGPTGGLGYVADRRDEEIAIVDLRATEATFRTVVAEFTTGEDPIDVAVSPDGSAVFTVSEGSQTLDVFGIGFGPVIASLSPAWAVPNGIVAVGGEGYATTDSTQAAAGPVSDMDFDGTLVGPTADGVADASFWIDSGWARVPGDFAGGQVRVISDTFEIGRRAVPQPGRLVSNPVVLSTWTPDEIDATRRPLFNKVDVEATDPLGGALSLNPTVHPRGDYALVDDGFVASFIDIREGSPTFLTIVAQLPLDGGTPNDTTDDIGQTRAFTPDGKLLYSHDNRVLRFHDADLNSPTFGQFLGTVDFTEVDPNGDIQQFNSLQSMAIAPTGDLLFVGVDLLESLVAVDLRGANANNARIALNQGSGSSGGTLRFHPNGRWLYQTSFGTVTIYDLDPFSSGYLQPAGAFFSQNGTIEDIAVDKQGRGFWAVARVGGLGGQWDLSWFEFIDSPSDVAFVASEALEISSPTNTTRIELHPNGLRAAIVIPERRVAYVDLSTTFGPLDPVTGNVNVFNGLIDIDSLGLFSFEGRWTPDGKRFVGIEQTSAIAELWDYSFPSGGFGFVPTSGASQTGVIGERLPAPVRVRVVNEGGLGEAGVLVRAAVTGGGGTIDDGLTERILITDPQGFVSVDWTLGPAPGNNSLIVGSVSGFGTTINATGVVSPETVPLSLVQVLPLDGATGVGVTTAVQAAFSRAVDRDSVPAGTIVLRDTTTGSPVPVFQGFSDGDRRVSLIPTAPLAYDRTYQVDVPASVADLDGNPLGAAVTSTFTTQAPPPPTLNGITPPAGSVGVPVVISGTGFDPTPGATTVTLNGNPVPVTDVTVNSARVVVPSGASTGPLSVAVNSTLAGSATFTVLVPTTIPVDEIDDSIDLGEATQALAVLPDGQRGYAVSTGSDQVIPVNLVTLTNGTPIAVGDEPIGAVSDVGGTFVYVANRGSNTVSVIDTATDTVVDTIFLDASPEAILASPNGDYVYVITPAGEAVEVIDVDASSATYNTVTARFTTGSGTVGGTVSPDGSVLFVFTDDGFVTIGLTTSDFGVTARFTTGSGTVGGTVSPDGTILFLFTNSDEILVIDVDGPGFGTVTARFTTGSGTVGGTVSPDGSVLYVINGETDEITAYAINVTGSVSVVEGLFLVDLEFLRTIDAGDDPRWIAFDPRDPSVAFVGATGDLAINVFGRQVNDPTTCDRFDVVFGTSWDPESSLQEILDAAYGVGAVDAATDYEGYDCDDAAVPYWLDDAVDGWIVREIGDYRGNNTLGWYAEDFAAPVIDGVDDGVIFDGSEVEGSIAFVGLPGPTRFGLYLNPNGNGDAINAPEPELFFTNRLYNDVGPDGSGALHAPDGGDAQALIYDVTALRGGVPTYVIAWEDVDSGAEITPAYSATGTDNDYNDLVVEIRASSPVRAVVNTVVAVPQADGVRVAWDVTGGVEVDAAVIERRTPSGDFATVGQVTGGRDFVDTTVATAGTYVYRVAVFVDGGRVLSNEVEVAFTPRVVRTALTKAYPNPFNPRTNIEYAIARPGDVKLRIYDVAGRLVKTYDLGEQPVGTGTVQWTGLDDNGRSVSSGVYLVKLITPERTDSLRVVLLK